MRAAIYRRVSTQQQTEGHSLDAQKATLTAYAASQGWQVVADYYDVISGSKADRNGLQALLQAAQAGEVDIVLIVDQDRLSRMEILEWEVLKRSLREAGVRLATPSQGIVDFADEDDEFVADLLNLLAKRERKKTAARVRRTLDTLVRQGKWRGGRPPYGYRLAGGTLEPDPIEAPIYLEIIRRYLDGEGPATIAAHLNRIGIPGQRGGSWRHRTIIQILSNPFYAGFHRWKGELLPHPYPRLIDATTWDRLQRTVKLRRRHRLHRQVASQALLAGMPDLVVCGICGAPVYTHVYSGRWAYYECRSTVYAQLNISKRCLRVPARTIDQMIAAEVHILLSMAREELYNYLRNHIPPDPTAALEQALRQELEDIERRIHRYLNEWEGGMLPSVYDRLKELEDRRQALRAELTQLSRPRTSRDNRIAQLMRYIDSHRTLWAQAPIPTRRAIIRTLFHRVTISPSKVQLQIG